MLIAGGVYVERCVAPETRQLLGSAGRASLALANLRQDIVLHCFQPERWWLDLRANFEPWGIRCRPHPAEERIEFAYLFPLDRPWMTPMLPSTVSDAEVEADEILVFGAVEGRFRVQGRAVVLDVQGATSLRVLMAGCSADRLALVLNAEEARALAQVEDVEEAGARLMRSTSAETIIIKDGPRGALAVERNGLRSQIPAYRSDRCYKIGSGDVFSAFFAHHWFEGLGSAAAADFASRRVADYVSAPSLPMPVELTNRTPQYGTVPKKVSIVLTEKRTTSAWLAALLIQPLERLGVKHVEVINLEEGNHDTGDVPRVPTLVCCTSEAEAIALRARRQWQPAGTVFFVDEDSNRSGLDSPLTRDLSQAIYDLCWLQS